MKIELTKRQWDAVVYALDLWLDCGNSTPFEKVGMRAWDKIVAARNKRRFADAVNDAALKRERAGGKKR